MGDRSIASLLGLLEPFVVCAAEDARERILAIAEKYQEEMQVSSEAPRRKQLREELREIADAASSLTAALERFRNVIASTSVWAEDVLTGDDIVSVNVLELPPIGTDPFANLRSRSGLVHKDVNRAPEDPISYLLDRIAEAERTTSPDALRQLASELADAIPPDKGGRGNIWIDRWGTPKWTLAEEGYWLFIDCRLGDAEQVDGCLLEFVSGLLEFASDGREEGSAMRPYLQRVVRWHRRLWAARKRIEVIDALLRNDTRLHLLSSQDRQNLQRELVELDQLEIRAMPRELRQRRENNSNEDD